MPGPSLAEIRAAGQPPGIMSRLNDEHWAGRLYVRRLSPRLTWLLARLGWTPNAVTLCFIGCGLAAGAVAALGGLPAALAAAVLVQGYLLFDCSDGELARLLGRTSVTGVYLDGIGHYLGETAFLAGLGLRAQGHLTVAGSYVTAGLAAALLAALIKAETDNVIVARAKSGLAGTYADEALAPRRAGLARARRLAGAVKLHRVIQPVELSLLVVAAAGVDTVRGGLAATRVLVVACVAIAGLLAVAHVVAIVGSRRLR